MIRYAVVIERGKTTYGAFSPDLPGCVSVGDSPEEALANFKLAVELHLEGLAEDGDPIPEPTCTVDYVEVQGPSPAEEAVVPTQHKKRRRA
jgi:predicted RNase H-like HicB family nuclease